MAASKVMHGGAFWPRKAFVRTSARTAAVVGVSLLLVAALGLWSMWLAAVAVILLMLANGMLIAHSYKGSQATAEYERAHNGSELASSFPTDDAPGDNQFDMRTCLQGYAMIPVTLTAVVSLAMYKADADLDALAGDETNFTKVQPGAVALLSFIGCKHVLSHGHTGATSVIHFHSRFLSGTICACALYLGMVGVHALCTSKAPANHSKNTRVQFMARVLFGVTVTLLVFAAVGFLPLILGTIAFVMSTFGSCILFANAHGHCGFTAAPTNLLQAHAFTLVTFACAFCFGCLMFEQVALNLGDEHARDVSLHFSGLEQALFAGGWLAITVGIRDVLNNLPSMT